MSHGKHWGGAFLGVALLSLLLVGVAVPQEVRKTPCPPDKNVCMRMIRQGDEAYSRAKYQEAKRYYRMAIAADPASAQAWASYDRALLKDLAQQVEQTGKFIPLVPRGDLEQMAVPTPRPLPAPGAPAPAAVTPPTATPAPPPAPSAGGFEVPPDRKGSFIREGC
jgi:hypothetical protein